MTIEGKSGMGSESGIHPTWLEAAPARTLARVIREYRHFVHRFPCWLALVIGRAEDQRVRQLLLPNLTEEAGEFDRNPSHLDLLDRLLESCGIDTEQPFRPSAATTKAEAWFYNVFRQRDTYAGLCVLGPGTEAVSQQFLVPLERGIRRAFCRRRLDTEYFDVHRADMEDAHVQSLEAALETMELQVPQAHRRQLVLRRKRWVAAAVAHHAKFWIACASR